MLALFLIPFFLPLLISVLTHEHIFLFRYATIFAPYFYSVVFNALTQTPKRIWLPLYTFLIFVNLGFWSLFLTGQAYQRQNWRLAADLLQSDFQPQDLVILEQAACKYPLWYYLDFRKNLALSAESDPLSDLARVTGVQWIVGTPAVLDPILTRVSRVSARGWLILCQAWLVDPDQRLYHWFVKHEQLVKHYELRSIEPPENIYLLLFHG